MSDICGDRCDGLVCERRQGHSGIHREYGVALWNREHTAIRYASLLGEQWWQFFPVKVIA